MSYKDDIDLLTSFIYFSRCVFCSVKEEYIPHGGCVHVHVRALATFMTTESDSFPGEERLKRITPGASVTSSAFITLFLHLGL